MASDTAFTVTIDNTNLILEAVEQVSETVLKQCGEVIEGYAKEDCPVDTGLLRNSLTYGLSGQRTNITSYTDNAGEQHGDYKSNCPTTYADAVYVGSNVEYAPAVEFKDRSHRVGKAHFLRDAGTNHFDELKDKAEKIYHARLG